MAIKSDQCLPIDYIQSDAGFHRSSYHVVVPRRFSFADTLNPEWWRYQTRINDGDIIDLLGEAGDFRHDWRALEVVPDCIEKPRWMQAIDPNDPDAAQKMTAWRQPTSPADWARVKAEDRRKREAAKQAAADTMPPEAALAEAALAPAEPGKDAHVHLETPTPQASDPAQKIMTRDDIRNARNRRSRMAKATRSKVQADKKDKAAAQAWGEKVIRKLEKEEPAMNAQAA